MDFRRSRHHFRDSEHFEMVQTVYTAMRSTAMSLELIFHCDGA
jgi:hypothetical protein